MADILGNFIKKFFTVVFAVDFEHDGAVEIEGENSENRLCVHNVSSATQIHVKVILRYDIDKSFYALSSIEK